MKRLKKNGRKVSRQRVLGVERLERREVLAGNVAAVVRGGNVILTGDGAANEISVTRSGPSSLTVTSGDGTTTINGQESVTLNRFRNHLTLNMGNGDDVVHFESSDADLFRVFGNLVVNTGNGNDEVTFADTSVWGTLTVNTGSGDDQISSAPGISDWGLRVAKTATFLAGRGNDTINLDRAHFKQTAVVLMEGGNDRLSISDSFFLKNTVLNGGLGFDRLDIASTRFGRRPTIVLFESRGTSPAPTVNPVANADAASVTRGGSATIDVTANDTSPGGAIDDSSIVITQNPANGSVTVNSNGTVTYTNNGSAATSDTFRYTVSDTDGNVSNSALVTITITANNPPVAVNDTATLNEGAAASINVAANDTDVGGSLDLTSVVITQAPANGTATPSNDGTVTYTHNGSETVTDTFRYTIKDNLGAVSNTATVSITITPVNDAPVAVNDTSTVNEGASGTINIASNDTDADGTIDLTSVVITQQPTNGSVTVNTNGTVSYTHNGSETTTDSFRYTIKDNTGAVSNTATVTVTVTPGNDPPVAANDTGTVNEGASTNINVASNDTDADGTIDLATVVIVQQPANGSVVVNANGTVDYTHNGSETTSDSFQYTIKDNLGEVSGTATVSITVTQVNDPPVAANDTGTVNEGASTNINVASNDTDADGTIDLATVVIVQQPANGSVVVNANGTVDYTHNGSETTSDSFQYTIKDNLGAVSNTATVGVTITPVNDPPTAADDAATVDEGGIATINVSSNDSDPEGALDLTSIVVTQSPAHGSVLVNPAGSVTYTHDGSETTSDSFQYTIKDVLGAVSGTATVAITVTPVNDPPVAVNDAATVDEGASASVNVAANDSDADGSLDLASIVITLNPVNGTAVANADGTVTYTHNGSETTSDSFQYTIKDNLGAVSGTATVTMTVTPVNDPPVAVDDQAAVNEGASVSINLAGNDTDAEAALDLTSIVVVQDPANGSVIVNSDGTVSYTHNGSETTSDSFQYTIKDNLGAVSGTATVSITVTPVNDPPVAVDDAVTIDEGSGAVIHVATNDTDVDGTLDLTSVVIVQGPTNGSVTVNSNGTVSYSHNGSETTTDSFQYTIQDNDGAVSNTATVTITVTPVNDPPTASDEFFDVTEDAGVPATGNVLTNDTDPEGTTLTISAVAGQGANVGIDVPGLFGTFHINSDGSFTYTLNDANTTVNDLNDLDQIIDSIAYDVSDSQAIATATAHVRIHGHTD